VPNKTLEALTTRKGNADWPVRRPAKETRCLDHWVFSFLAIAPLAFPETGKNGAVATVKLLGVIAANSAVGRVESASVPFQCGLRLASLTTQKPLQGGEQIRNAEPSLGPFCLPERKEVREHGDTGTQGKIGKGALTVILASPMAGRSWHARNLGENRTSTLRPHYHQ